MIVSGRLRERVTILKPVEEQNPFGETTLSWVSLSDVWASVTNLSASDYFSAQQAGTLASHRVTIRFFPGMSPTYRLVWRGRTLDIVSVNERESRSLHEIIAKEEVA
jgi:SPP1 family predicted phage head-tail adaptor